MNDVNQTGFLKRLRQATVRLLSIGVAACGIIIVWTGMDLRDRLSGPYQTNLKALSATINELNKTVFALQKDTATFNRYLDTLRLQLKQTGLAVDAIDKETKKLLALSGTAIPKVLDDTSKAVTEASKTISEGSNSIGNIPGDPFAATRSNLYLISGTLSGMAQTMEPVAEEVRNSSRDVATATGNGMASMMVVLTASEVNLKTLQHGSMERLPDVMEALSGQLKAHLHLIESSYDFVSRISTPLIALGVGFILMGLRGFIWVIGE